MAKIIGGTAATPMRVPDWNQTNPHKADYIKNKPEVCNALKGKESGNPIVLSDVSPLPHEIKVKLSGAKGGKNLFYFPRDINESLWDSAVIAQKGTSVMTVPVGEAVDDCFITINLDSFNLDVNKTYTLSIRGDYIGDSGLPATLNDVGFENAGEEYDWNCVYITFTPSQSNTITIDVGEYYYGGDLYFLLEEGETVTEYEDYVAGVDVNGAVVQRYGLNLFDQETTFAKLGFRKLEDGSWLGNPIHDERAFVIPFPKKGAMYFRYEGKATGLETVNPFYARFHYTDGKQSGAIILKETETEFVVKEFTSPADKTVDRVIFSHSTGANESFILKYFMVSYEGGGYEPYVEPITYTADEEGNISIVGNGESMTLIGEEGVTMEAEYNRDINKAFAELQNAIATLGAAAMVIPEEV